MNFKCSTVLKKVKAFDNKLNIKKCLLYLAAFKVGVKKLKNLVEKGEYATKIYSFLIKTCTIPYVN